MPALSDREHDLMLYIVDEGGGILPVKDVPSQMKDAMESLIGKGLCEERHDHLWHTRLGQIAWRRMLYG